MLNSNELLQIASFKRLPIKYAEKDYLQDLILFSIYSKISEELVFKGGTCLYKVYKLNRFSEDLDFTLNKDIDVKKTATKIINDLLLLNINSKIMEIKDYKNQKNVRLLFNGPLYKGTKESQCFIPLNLSLRQHTILEPKKEKIFTMYKEIQDFSVFSMNEEEIMAEKISTIFMRDKARDIYDLWFLFKKGIKFNIDLTNKKLKFYNLEFNNKEFISSIQRKKNFWETDLKNLVLGELPKFGDVSKYIKSKL